MIYAIKPPRIKRDLRHQRLLLILAFAVFTVSAWTGIAPAGYLAIASITGLLSFGTLVLSFRFRSYAFYGLSIAIFLSGHHYAERLVTSELWSFYFQHLSLAFVFYAGPALLFHQRLLHLCQSNDTANA